MSASFRLTLDTVTHVAAAINGGKGFTSKPTVTLELTLDPDAALVKIWGDINPLDPMNTGMGTTEETAEWLSPQEDWLVALTTNPGPKELHVAVRDDVDNEALTSASVVLEGEGPPIPPVEPEPTHPEAIPASGAPEVVPKPVRRELISIGSVGKISSTVVIATTRTLAPSSIGGAPRSSSSVSSTRLDRSQVSTRVTTSISATAPVPGSSLRQLPSAATVRHRDGETFIATLVDLGIL